MLKFSLLFIIVLFSGCVSMQTRESMISNMYNVASSDVSKFDGTKHIRLSRMVCSNAVMFELYQDTHKAKQGYVLLSAGSKSIDNIGNGKSLHIKIDGKTYSFKSNDLLTNHEAIPVGYGVNINFSHKDYIVPETVIREIASAKQFLTKMELLNNTYIEGICSSTTLEEARETYKHLNTNLTQKDVDLSNKYTAASGFSEFVKMMDATIW